MGKGTLSVQIESQSYFLGSNLPVEIRDAHHRLVEKRKGNSRIELPAGLYSVEAVLPDGGREAQLVHVVADDESTLTFTHENGRTRSFYTDGRTETHEMRRGDGEVEVSASLDDGVLVISSVRSDGATMTRTLQVSADGQQLTVTHAMANPARGHSGVVRVVFDRAQ